jgi:hypothetical protein
MTHVTLVGNEEVGCNFSKKKKEVGCTTHACRNFRVVKAALALHSCAHHTRSCIPA